MFGCRARRARSSWHDADNGCVIWVREVPPALGPGWPTITIFPAVPVVAGFVPVVAAAATVSGVITATRRVVSWTGTGTNRELVWYVEVDEVLGSAAGRVGHDNNDVSSWYQERRDFEAKVQNQHLEFKGYPGPLTVQVADFNLSNVLEGKPVVGRACEVKRRVPVI